MESKWAEENLQTIRTLMERSALYRRALAPIMILVGALGIGGGIVGWQFSIKNLSGFLLVWIGVAVISFTGALLLVRRQALKDSEPFWSPPTRRIAQALMPAFFIGLMLAIFALIGTCLGGPDEDDDVISIILIIIWSLFYGCAIHAACFFMPRGVRWLGWIFVIIGLVMLFCFFTVTSYLVAQSPHLLMAEIFGGLHLACGFYLYFTENKNPVA